VTETESCAGCHADAAAQWRSSAHAFASFNNPVYRVVVDAFRTRAGPDKSLFCAGCHDVALLVDGAMGRDVTPDDARAHGGVTCRVCHGIETAQADGNASYVLASSPVPIPRDGDDESLRAHKARMAPSVLRTPLLCGSCHRSFLSQETGDVGHIVGQDELGAWQRSAYAGSFAARIDEPVERAECRNCHMPLEDAPQGDAAAKDGKIRSHRFVGAHTWLAAMRGDEAQLQAERTMLRAAATIDIAAATADDGTRTLPADGAPLRAGVSQVFEVVVRNERVGHRFPGGVLDAQDTWIELTVHDAHGKLVAEAGGQQFSSGEDGTAHRLRAVQVDEQGTPLRLRETDRFRTAAFNHTIAPRDAEVVRYRFTVPSLIDVSTLPWRVSAQLRHRSRDLALARVVCADARTVRGAAFTREVRSRTGGPFDPCAREPVTNVAEAEVWIGAGSEGRERPQTMPPWRRLFDHGLGLLSALQEDLESARLSLNRAWELAPLDAIRPRAMIVHALAVLAAREGRTDEALRYLDEAERLAGYEPAILSTRGQVLGNVWRWGEAIGPLERAANASPLDDALWSHLAIARASAGDPRAALEAAVRGLELAPRDADMLRVQALALERIAAPADDVSRAQAAFGLWRPPDDAPAMKQACSARFAWCALERLPAHVHEMRTAP
jgi:hypothetical protein